ncbi:MAG: hypothetical protein KJ905_03855 [Nanoarchaeota archaeon]|nr:hypothetical protein [Nanoarchaeota archaeon]MBU1501876.1 hypothetical protein [Nanoarchaeota archaeon]MBU2458803.1 hypothetical protein [Nanoarchaeota archaeon]
MRQAILDTSFILICVKQKIDFFNYLFEEGIKPIIPLQTISELKCLDAELALKILEGNKFQTVRLPGKDADNAIIKFAKKNPEAIVATLDVGLKKKIKNRKLVIRGKKKLEII